MKEHKVSVHKGYYWRIEVTTSTGRVDLDIFFLKNGVQVMYNQRCSSFLLPIWDEKKAWAICQTMLNKADDKEVLPSYTDDIKKQKKILQRYLKDRSSVPEGPLFDLIRQAWGDWQLSQRQEQAVQLKQAVKRLSPDEITLAVAEAQIEDVYER